MELTRHILVRGLLAALLLCAAACTGRLLPGDPPPCPRCFDTAEKAMILEGSPGEPLAVVYNDSDEGDAILRATNAPVNPDDPVVEHLIRRMLAAVNVDKGVGIAAPQVGVNRRVVLVQRLDIKPSQPFVSYLNPEITEFSEETAVGWEGCLSIPAGFGKVRRSTAITVEWDGEDGKRHSERIEGFVAVIFQHEIDHLNGTLFIDRMESTMLVPKEEYRRLRQQEKEAEKQAEQQAPKATEPAPEDKGDTK